MNVTRDLNHVMRCGLLFATWFSGGSIGVADESVLGFRRDVLPLLNRYCIECHGPAKAESGFRVDRLPAVSVDRAGLEQWSDLAERIKAADMPPPDAAQPSEAEVGLLIDWVTRAVRDGATRLKPRERRARRRMTKAQYTATLQDLTGLPLRFGDVLPDDGPGPSGFTNDVETLGFTSAHGEQFLLAAQSAVARILPPTRERVFDPQTDYDFVLDFERIGRLVEADEFVEAHEGTHRRTRAILIPVDAEDLDRGLVGADFGHHGRGRAYPFDVAAIWTAPLLHRFNSKGQPVVNELAKFREGMYVAPHGNRKIGRHASYPQGSIRLARGGFATSGWARISVTAAAEVAPGDVPPKMFVTIRLTEDLNNRVVHRPAVFTAVETVTAPATRPRTYSFFVCLDNLGLLSQEGVPKQEPVQINGSSPKKLVDLGGVPPLISVYNGERLPDDQDGVRVYPTVDRSQLLIERISVQWPCEPPTSPVERLGLVVPEASTLNAELSALRPSFDEALERIWRSPVDDDLAEPIYGIYRAARDAGQGARQALRESLTAALCSPQFLYLDQSTCDENDHRLTERALATRLSYFLWDSMPDERLMELAAKGRLSDPNVRAREAERMLADPRSDRFFHQFMDQWMMRGLDGVAVDTERFNDFDDGIRRLLRAEARVFLGHLVREDLPLTTLLTAKFRMLNHDLAKYYGIENAGRSNTFEKVVVPESTPTAGLLTLGAPLIVRGNGMESNPFARGSWVLGRILGTPPPSPPPSVPELPDDPDFENLPLRERLAMHRTAPSCASCHSRLDPWGIALEHYDASGRRRTKYLDLERSTLGRTGSKLKFRVPVSSEANLRDGTPVNDVLGVRDAILNTPRRELFVKHMARLLLSYGIGRSLTVDDDPALEELTTAFAEGNTGLRSAIVEVVRHPAFALP